MNLNDELLEKAAKQHALEVLGKDQYNDPNIQVAKESIMEDFKAGVEWYIEYLKKQKIIKNN